MEKESAKVDVSTIVISADLRDKVKIQSVIEKRTIREVVESAIVAYLQKK